MKFKIGDKVIEMIEDDGLSKKDIVKSVFDALKENAHKVKKSEEEEPYVEIVYNVHAMSEDGTAYGTVATINEDGDMEACHWDYKNGEFEFSRKNGKVSEEILKRREEIESKLIDAIADKSTDEAEAKAMGFAHDAECKDDGERMEEEEFKKYKGLTRVMFNDLLEAAKNNKKIDNAVDLLEDYISTLPFVPIDTDSDVTVVYVDKDNGILIIDGDDDSALDEIVEDSKKKSVKDVKLISDITDYVPWSGARETWDKIVAAKKVNEFDAILEDIYPEGLTMTELNNILWFDDEDVLNWLGISEEVEDSCKKDSCKDSWINVRGTTSQGYEVRAIYNGKSGRLYAVIYRPRTKDFLVAAGYHQESGDWEQGYYDFVSEEEARKFTEKHARQMGDSCKKDAKKSCKDATYRGVPGTTFIWNGEWADPEIEYKGYTMNYWDIEDALWNEFLEETGHKDNESNDPKVEDEFDEYVQYRFDGYFDDILYGGYFNEKKSWRDKKRRSPRDAKSKKICDICGQEVKSIEKIGQHFSVCPECKRHMKESDIELLK